MEEQLNFSFDKIYIQRIKLCVVRENSNDEKLKVTDPEAIAKLKLIKDELLNSDREKFICLHLDTKHQLISYEIVSVGSLSMAIVHPRELFKGAILSNASSVILCHNHPSGVPEPSREDIDLTRRLRDAGELLGVQVLDHLIFGHDNYKSFKEIGLL
jgi:DNA repair protein RadC